VDWQCGGGFGWPLGCGFSARPRSRL
jgi:Transposase DDE domain